MSDQIEQFAWAVKTGDLKNVKDAIEKQGLSANYVEATVNKRTPLHWAADYGQVEVIEYLLSKGANIEAKDNFGITPLLAAVYEGHANAVKVLLQRGARRDVKGPDGMTPLEAAEKAEIKALLRMFTS